MPNVFISYRREGSAGHAGRLFDHLIERFGQGSVFMDVAGIDPGTDFVEAIDRAVGSCDALIVVIGNGWLTCVDAAGARRLDDPKDFIRLEVATALRRNVRVIPVLVEGAKMPRGESLPADLQPLSRRQAIELSDTRWNSDLGQLIRALQSLRPARRRWKWKASILVAAVAAAAALIYFHPWLPAPPEAGGGIRWPGIPTPSKSPSGERHAKEATVTDVPDVTGATREAAEIRLNAAGLSVGKVNPRPTGDRMPGLVLITTPSAGTRVARGATVDLVVTVPLPRQPAAAVARGVFEFHDGSALDLDSNVGPSDPPRSRSDPPISRSTPDVTFRTIHLGSEGYLAPVNGARLALMNTKPDYDLCTRASMRTDRFFIRGRSAWFCASTNNGRYSALGVNRRDTVGPMTLDVNYVTWEPRRTSEIR